MNSGHTGTYLPGSLQGRTCTWTRFVANADKDFEVGPKTCMLTCNATYVKRDCKIATCPCTQVQLLEPFMEHRILFLFLSLYFHPSNLLPFSSGMRGLLNPESEELQTDEAGNCHRKMASKDAKVVKPSPLSLAQLAAPPPNVEIAASRLVCGTWKL